MLDVWFTYFDDLNGQTLDTCINSSTTSNNNNYINENINNKINHQKSHNKTSNKSSDIKNEPQQHFTTHDNYNNTEHELLSEVESTIIFSVR